MVVGNSRYSVLGSDHCCPFYGKIKEIRISNSTRSAFNSGLSDPVEIGLSKGNHNILDTDKVNAFFNLNYNTTKDVLGIGYDFQVKFVNSNRTLGSDPPVTAQDIILIRRFALYNNSIEEVQMKVWS